MIAWSGTIPVAKKTTQEDAVRIIVSMVLISVPLWASGNEAVDRFKLFTHCAAVKLVIDMSSRDTKISLTKESVQTAVESRLRSARIYTSEAPDYFFFYVNIAVVGNAFGVDVKLHKKVFDSASQNWAYAPTWWTGSTGVHGNQNANFILSSLSQQVDEFLVEYLRVNEEACQNN